MKLQGIIRKMRSENTRPVSYYLPVGDGEVSMNEFIGSEISLHFSGNINCIKCGRETRKSFAQGYCYPCFTTAPETEECVLRPELCTAHEGVARDMEYARDHCLIEQVVYLSITSGLKVGVTRSTQVPFRWIDQGAVSAIELARVPNRYTAGRLEVLLKENFRDKTNWRGMLKNEIYKRDLLTQKDLAITYLEDQFRKFRSENDTITEISYPVEQYPVRVKSLNFDKDPQVEGKLVGIKGQYLIFEGDKVINIRKFGGYEITIEA